MNIRAAEQQPGSANAELGPQDKVTLYKRASMPKRHREKHKLENIGWLRAAVLGANAGIVSTSSLILGVASSHASHLGILVAGAAGRVAGAMSMATGEYVSVQSQADTEQAALEMERAELAENPAAEHLVLVGFFVSRGLVGSLVFLVVCLLL